MFYIPFDAEFNGLHFDEDNNDIVIIDAPSYDPTLILPTQMMNDKKFHSYELWNLEDAVTYTFGLYLSKLETLRRWSIGLHVNLCIRDTSFSFNYRHKLVKYTCLDCITVAHLNLFMQQSNIPLDLKFAHQENISGEYNLSNNLSVVPDIFQVYEESSLSSIEQSDKPLVAVHVFNERH
ncbi:unnamed protein product [Rotaria sp. Silwood2]|nr:unnamed protein product [Rotaria sp. Silwood2]CAF2917412.1 unnamed protein product [Rotaria sp. Silwood2]CAF4333997.1 unnamed protein product [Rotaria sp. Silwood2]